MTKTKKTKNNHNNSPQSPPSWSNLPLELLAAIAQRLENNRLLNLRFHSVCNSWRSACPPYNHDNNNDDDNNNVLSLFPISDDRDEEFKANTLYLVEPKEQQLLESSSSCSKCWIIMVNELKPGGVFSLRHPLSRSKIGTWTNEYPKVLNLLDFRVTEIATCITYFGSKALMVPSNLDFGFANGLSLAVVFASNVLRIFNSADRRAKSVRGIDCIDDIVDFNGSICTVDHQGRLFSVSGESLIHQISRGLGMKKCNRKRLVVSNKDLYLITPRMDYVRVSFLVYKLCETTGKWVQVRGLSDQVFFIGENCSFSFSAQAFPGFQGNCIFASADSFEPFGRYYFSQTLWSKYYNKNFKDQKMVGMFDLSDCRSFEEIGSSDPFWPPPSWVTSNITSRVEKEIESENPREREGEIAEKFESNNDNGDIQNVGTLSLEGIESRYQKMEAVGHDDCEAINRNSSMYGAVEGSHFHLGSPCSLCHVETSLSADHIQSGLQIEDFEVVGTHVDLLRAILQRHPQAFTRVNAKDAWMRGWAAEPALRAYRLLIQGNDSDLSEAELQNVEDLVNVAERVGVEVNWLRKPLEQAWEYCNRLSAWHCIDEKTIELDRVRRLADEQTIELDRLRRLADELTIELDRLRRLAGENRPTPGDRHFID